MFTLFLIILILVAVAMVTAILLQAGTGGGLAAMGGGASSDSFLGGRQATTILTKATWWLGGIFLGLSLLLAGMSTRTSMPRSVLDSEPVAPAPIVPPTQLPLNVEPEQSPGTTPPQPQN
ncbi:MAG: preprotein translocase subunit SecG [Gemmatimonadota bacterium]|nr:preprotein translocase subunit SecG [Gemmatimonadota bacterium]MDH3367816.1 preprotein translocase subunit SecG [Gemmatimonadota bacterium]MDH3479513.1 preprotein translocase subunit SecG [Gemmatimonadota bacterium]MDH3571093.1 preprotein translocase subunit SecG [Gemmatimonadota bacterium]MDH5549625.1 preprotein translocase subunit SecG [Gemmatimonadota bacterium]